MQDDGSILYVLKSRKFWFAWFVPVALTIAAAALGVITPGQAIAGISGLSAVYGGTVAWEDVGKAHAEATVEVAHVQAAVDEAREQRLDDDASTRAADAAATAASNERMRG